jgi:hypothetical protein
MLAPGNQRANSWRLSSDVLQNNPYKILQSCQPSKSNKEIPNQSIKSMFQNYLRGTLWQNYYRKLKLSKTKNGGEIK